MTNEELKAASEWHDKLTAILKEIPLERRDDAISTARQSLEEMERRNEAVRRFQILRIEDMERLIGLNEREIDNLEELDHLRRQNSDMRAVLKALVASRGMRADHMVELVLPRLVDEAGAILGKDDTP
jgi:hypothetical protein